jgi:hypothetical protein
MIQPWAVLAYSLAYVGFLFAIAYWGDERARRRGRPCAKPVIYALSLAVHWTSWTFYGSVGLAAKAGYSFLPIYLGPILVFALGWPLLRRIVRISKAQNITSIADFIAARYGKSQIVAATVTVIAVLGTLSYIVLQLKALSTSFRVLLQYPDKRNALAHREPATLERHGADRLVDPRPVRDLVRHPPHRRDRAPRGHDPGDRVRIGGQADRVPGGRRFRHLGCLRGGLASSSPRSTRIPSCTVCSPAGSMAPAG